MEKSRSSLVRKVKDVSKLKEETNYCSVKVMLTGSYMPTALSAYCEQGCSQVRVTRQLNVDKALLTLEYVREMILRFTGSEIEIVRPLMVIDEQIVLED